MAACSLAWLAQLAGWHWLVTIDAAKIQPIRRNEDESTDGGLNSKIDSISKGRRGNMYDATYVRICTNEREHMCQPRDKQPACWELWFFTPYCFFLGLASQKNTPM